MRMPAPRRFVSGLVLAAACFTGMAAPAMASEILLKDGSRIWSERLHYTYTHLIVVTSDNDMRLVPNDQVKEIDGIPFQRAYWEERPGHEESAGGGNMTGAIPGGTHASGAAAAIGGAAIDRLLPLKPGTFRRYDLEQVRTTWVRRGRKMERRETVEADGSVRENVTGPREGGTAVNVLEIITEKSPGKPAHEITLRHAIEGRPDGYYLVHQSLQDANLAPTLQEDALAEPPRLWPQDLKLGQSWTIGPFTRLGLGQVMKMEVVGVEPITVPAGAYPEAYKIVGKGNVFNGAQQLKHGRIVTDHGSIETTTWIVPGIGPVRELSKVHVHQTFFPYANKSAEIPLVVEEEATRTLAEFHLGQ